MVTLSELTTILPHRVKRTAGSGSALIVDISQAGLFCVSRRSFDGTHRTMFESSAKDWRQPPVLKILSKKRLFESLILKVHESSIIETVVSLPAIESESLEQFILRDLCSYSPFMPNDIFWAVAGEARGGPINNHGKARLIIVPKHDVEWIIRGLAELGDEIDFIECRGACESYVLSFSYPNGASKSIRGRPLAVAAALSAAVISICLMLCLQLITAISLQSKVDSFHDTFAHIDDLGKTAARANRFAILVRKDEQDSIRILESIKAISDDIPDNGYLNELQVDGAAISITGQASSAAEVIKGIALDTRFSAPHFTSSIIPADGSPGDHFSIAAVIHP